MTTICHTLFHPLRRPFRRLIRHHAGAVIATAVAPLAVVCVSIPAWLVYTTPPSVGPGWPDGAVYIPEPAMIGVLTVALGVLYAVRKHD